MKKAVVTFITGKREFLYPPVLDFAGVDFLCYTDLEVKSRFWKICPLNGLSIEEIKNLPKEYLPQYEQVEFVDACDVITMGSDGGVKVVERPDISVCVDEEYLNEVRRVTEEKTVVAERAMEEKLPQETMASKNANNAAEASARLYTGDNCTYPYILTIGMLIGRNSPYFDECFASLLRIMDAIPESELIIVDTGNEDGSVDKVRKAAEAGRNITIVPFTWIHDFAAARNEAVTRARGSWFMSIDDDEWFEDISALVDFFKSDKGLYKRYDYALYTQRNYLDREGRTYNDASIVRLAKNRPDLRYRRRIHENFNFKEKEIAPYAINSYVHHYGYLNNLESRKEKSKRNMALLLLANEENPTDTHVLVQIVQEMAFTERYELAYWYALRGLSVQRLAADFHIGTFVAMLVKALRVVDKAELWNYETRYIKNTELSYIETAYVTYQYALTAYEKATSLAKPTSAQREADAIGEATKKMQSDIRRYTEKVVEYSTFFETVYFDYNRASKDVQLAVAATVCDNFCSSAGYLADMLIVRALACELKGDNKAVAAALKKVKPANISRFPMDFYSLLVRYDMGTCEFYRDNENAPGIWMLFVQALLQKPDLCAALLKNVSTPCLEALIEGAQRYISPARKPAFDRIFEGLVILRLICEYMQAGDSNMALNAVKIALQGSEQVKAVAMVLLDELKRVMD